MHLGDSRQQPLLLQLLLQLAVLVDLFCIESELFFFLLSFVVAGGFGSGKSLKRQAFWVLAALRTAVLSDLGRHSSTVCAWPALTVI